MIFVLVGTLLILTLLLGYAALKELERYLDSPLTDTDRYLGSVDAELDELEARRATAPLTNGVLVDFPRRPAA